ncbi:hypothetical protein ER308_04530 [Egibacter rhizosphaerae]|uniref:Uncharacterized protein n=1 Tax=Egibacter rhizosphaerae TaxID=1670831 RepID=A0A411YCJ3_9ACTN|nr:hypothetical protein [Egibacter rhizosphaerae]QBI18882.1 hypothetical protein ER308_04530 [Egibacter rhizosphaerae]
MRTGDLIAAVLIDAGREPTADGSTMTSRTSPRASISALWAIFDAGEFGLGGFEFGLGGFEFLG